MLISPPGELVQWLAYRDEERGFALPYSDCFAISGSTESLQGLRTDLALTLAFVGTE
jgi:hypothetical protein